MQTLKRTFNLFKRISRPASCLSYFHIRNIQRPQIKVAHLFKSTTSSAISRKYCEESLSDSEEDLDLIYKPNQVKNLLYAEPDDPLIAKLNKCASIQQVFDFINKYENILAPQHLAQAVLVLTDLQKIFYHINLLTNVGKLEELMNNYSTQLVAREEFDMLLKLIASKIQDFDLESLATNLLYLNKMGLQFSHPLLQSIIEKLVAKFEDGEISLSSLSRFFIATFTFNRTSAYFICKNIIPYVFNFIDNCQTSDDIKLITICLNNLNDLITKDILERYKNKVVELIEKDVINGEELNTIIKIMYFLNYPKWRNENTNLMARCMLLLKNKINCCNVHELLLIYEIFCKIQEPAEILNELQRCACKFLHEFEEESGQLLQLRLRLLACVVYFSSPIQRSQFEKVVRKYMDYILTGQNLLELGKIIQHTKIIDPMIYKLFWDKLLCVMEHDEGFKNKRLLNVCTSYQNLNKAINLRHFKIEKRLNQWLEGEIEQSISNFIPSRYAKISAFVFTYGNDVSILNHLVNKLRDNWEQLNHIDCLRISKSLWMGLKLTRNPLLKPRYVQSINETLNKCLENHVLKDVDIDKCNFILRSCFYREKYDENVIFNVIKNYENIYFMSSNLIKTITFCLKTTNVLVPSAIDFMVMYICKYKENVSAFHAEKVAYLCYHFGYTPTNYDEFFSTFIDIIIRDQERLNGLSFLQACLSLCFFNKITDTFIKQIFNTTFLEKLENELVNCYSKDIYPHRVRYRLMQLNRTVCIDYPECNVPWFHQKYFDEKCKTEEGNVSNKLGEYLVKIFNNSECIETDFTTPYGYNIDYVIKLGATNKIALLLIQPNVFTKINVRLKGQYHLKMRHLEMFGYRVALLNLTEWKHLVYGEDKVNYLKDILKFKLFKPDVYQINR